MDQATLREILRVQFEDAGINPLPGYYDIGLNLFEMNQSVPTVDYILSMHMQTHGGMAPGVIQGGMIQGGMRAGGPNPLRALFGQMMGNGGNGGNPLIGNGGNLPQLGNFIIHPPGTANPMEVEVEEREEVGEREEDGEEDDERDEEERDEGNSERNQDTDEEERNEEEERDERENTDTGGNINSLRRNQPAHRHQRHTHGHPIRSDQEFIRFIAGVFGENGGPNMMPNNGNGMPNDGPGIQFRMNGADGNVASFVFQPNMAQMIDVKSVLSKEEMNNLPLIYIDETNNKFDQQECINCYDPFVKSDLVRILPCGHKFHHLCIDNQLTKESHLCPLCKNPAGNYTHINM